MRTVIRSALIPSYERAAAATAVISSTPPILPLPLLMLSAPASPRSFQRLSAAVWEVYHLLHPSSTSPSHQLTRGFRPIHTSSSKLRPESSSSSSEAATAVPSQSTSLHSKLHQCVSSADGVRSAVTEVPIVCGSFFRLVAGKSAVRIEHFAGWSDTATLEGQTAGGGLWRAVPIDTASVTPSTLASVRQAYEVRQGVDGSKSGTAAATAVAVTTPPSDGAPGLLQLTAPEKWISMDVRTSGCSVAVSKIVEADLRVATGGAAVTLGSVRGLQVDIDTSVARSEGVDGHTRICADAAGSHDGVGDSCDGSSGGGCSDDGSSTAPGAAVMGGEVSGTSISIVAAGIINVRRLVGGTMRLTANLESIKSPSLPSGNVSQEAVTAAAAKQGIELGAVYGGRLQISTGGGSVRIGTLDCGAARMRHPSDTSAINHADLAFTRGSVNDSGSGSDADADTNAFILPNTAGGGDRDVSARSSGSGGADILSHGGAVVLDGVEGDLLVDSGGGRIKVLIQAGLRSARLVSGGAPVDVALAPGVALRLLEVHGAAEVEVQPDLQHHLERVLQAPQARAVAVGSRSGSGESSVAMGDGGSSNASGGNSSSGTSRVWVARLVPEPEGGRGTSRAGSGRRGRSGGVLTVDAGGGTVSFRRLEWMEALKAKLQEKHQTGQPQTGR
ncbi:hypothetical protein VaNZ11_008612 [Volvox africanus]|uniref:Adhesin domain-containing protein n=1 Tax=Volvox africanus TaxID=51714 RepID=A0ABQ5S5H8_9CHLO|nr:hypothetical protein VaNZ11_008612 [Volvox africanus]